METERKASVCSDIWYCPIGEDWTKDPLKCTQENGYLFGRGVLDDKGPAMAGFYAMKMLRDNNVPISQKIMLILGCDEESGMECMEYYKEHAEVPKYGFVPDADFPATYGEKAVCMCCWKARLILKLCLWKQVHVRTSLSGKQICF